MLRRGEPSELVTDERHFARSTCRAPPLVPGNVSVGLLVCRTVTSIRLAFPEVAVPERDDLTRLLLSRLH